MRIAVDAMGGDHAPDRPVAGAPAAIPEAARDFGIVLVGDESRLTPLLSRDTDFRGWSVLHAPDAIGMDGSPASAALTTLGRIESPRSASMVVFPNRAEQPDLANPIGPPAVAAERGER